MRSGSRVVRLAAAAACVLAGLAAAVRSAEPAAQPADMPASPSGAEILQELKEFRTFGTVLMVAAHPDDENRVLLAYLSKGRDYRTGYLSINRGDGGQNEIGPEFGEILGVIRTQELLAGRRIDGARQFFTRAIDFGYSKSLPETLAIWDHQEVLGDVVRVIRTFRPDVVITRFSTQPNPNQHGHHTASAVLALEAFKLAGDPKAYPEQLAEGLAPWQPTRIVQNGGASLVLNPSGSNPATGETFQAMAARTSAQHKTQGVGGNFGPPRQEGFTFLAGTPATSDIMDGVDTTWARVPNGGAEIAKLADDLIANFKPDYPDASVTAILALRTKLAALPPVDPPNSSARPTAADVEAAQPLVSIVLEKRALLDRILQHCLGLTIEVSTDAFEVVPGERIKLHYNIQSKVRVSVYHGPIKTHRDAWGPGGIQRDQYEDLGFGIPTGRDFIEPMDTPLVGDTFAVVPAAKQITQPYWLREEAAAGVYCVAKAETKLIGQAEDPAPFMVESDFGYGNIYFTFQTEVRVPGETGLPGRRVSVVSPVSLSFGSVVALFTPGAKKSIEVEVTAARAGASGTLHLESPAGWTISPASQPFKFTQAGEKTKLSFSVTAPAAAASGSLLAVAEMADGTRYSNQHDEIHYAHIPVQILQPPARLKVAAFDFAIRGKAVGYLPGAGDDTASSLQQLGYAVTTLTGADLTPEKLRGLDAVVLGVRAFNERTDLAANLPGLLAYAEQGGTVIAQYNRPNGLRTPQLGPYPLSIAGQAPALRVTDETAPVTFLLPDHPALNTPNKITAADFAGWVQERGAYFASSWDGSHYAAPLGMSDPGETQPESSLLIAPIGKGFYVYTSLAFFRQLPAGVPGAYRLFANLVSLGK